MKSPLLLSAAGFALTFALAGCGNNASTTDTSTANGAMAPASTTGGATASNTKLSAAGATFPLPIYTKWFGDYKDKTGVQINYQPVGSSAGIKQLKNQTVDFAGSDAPLKEKDLAAMPAPVVQIPSVGGAVVVAYNVPGAPANLKLSGEDIAGIFMGTIKKWNDPALMKENPGAKLPDSNIIVVHRADGSGTTNIFTTYLSQVSPQWKAKIGAGKTVDWPVGLGAAKNDGVAAAVNQSKGSVGYIELAYALQKKTTVAAIKNAAGNYITPSVESTTAAIKGALPTVQKDITAPISNAEGAQAYPIAALTYLLVYKQAKNPATGKAVTDFLKWAMTDGQPAAAQQDYAPLPKSLVDLNMKTIDELK